MNNEELLKLAEAGDIEALHKLEENLRNRVSECKPENLETVQKKFPGVHTANEWLKDNRDIEIKSLHVIPQNSDRLDIFIDYIPKENTGYIYQFIVEEDVYQPIRMIDEASVKQWQIRHTGWKPVCSVLYKSGTDETLYLNMFIPIPLDRMKERTITLAVMPYKEYQTSEQNKLEENRGENGAGILKKIGIGILLIALVLPIVIVLFGWAS